MKKRWFLFLLLFLILAVGGFVIWAEQAPAVMPEALSALQSDDIVKVDLQSWIVFSPVKTSPSLGLILYPGGRVDPRAYSPAAKRIAEQGYLVVIVPMPLNLAVFNPGEAQDVIDHFTLLSWVIGGHSLGGAMAARFAYMHSDLIEGLVLWAAYPADSNDLSDADLAVVSIYGTSDGLATVDKVQASRALLPPTTSYIAIEGGNHAQFGWYGEQAGDNPGTISREGQQAQIVSTTLEFLENLDPVSY